MQCLQFVLKSHSGDFVLYSWHFWAANDGEISLARRTALAFLSLLPGNSILRWASGVKPVITLVEQNHALSSLYRMATYLAHVLKLSYCYPKTSDTLKCMFLSVGACLCVRVYRWHHVGPYIHTEAEPQD